jgi:phosphohistidine phosphatase
MRTLSLFRHAKSDRDDPAIPDFERPLAPRGEKAARAMGAWMERNGHRPDLVLSSPSERTRATCALAFASLSEAPELVFETALYLASPRQLLARLAAVPSEVEHLMLVGHNPGLHALATTLVGSGAPDLRALIDDKLPTAGLVIIAFDAAGSFADALPGTGRLVDFVVPKRLPE